VIGQKTAAIALGEEPRETPFGIRQGANVEDIDHQQVAGLGALHPDRATQIMHLGEIHVPDVVGRIVIQDLATGPVDALDPEAATGLDHFHKRQVRMPAVVQDTGLFCRRFGKIDLDQGLRHKSSPMFGIWSADGIARKSP